MKKLLGIAAVLLFAAGSLGAQTITVVKPAAGESIPAGTGYTVVWTKTGTMGNAVRITLRNAQTLDMVRVLSEGAPNTGSFGWQMSGDVPPGQYVVRVRVVDGTIADDGGVFTITAPLKRVEVPPLDRPRIPLGRPALSISGAAVVCNVSAFAITFAYKNTGNAPLPKASAMPVKPDFRVLIDDREVNRGTLIFPAFEAQPGWEVPSFFAHEIAVPVQGSGADDPYATCGFSIGQRLTVEINSNRVNGMPPASRTFDLHQLGLQCAYDASIANGSYDWKTETVTVDVRFDGQAGAVKKFSVWSMGQSYSPMVVVKDVVPGQRSYRVSGKMPMAQYPVFDGYLLVMPLIAPGRQELHDVHYPNNRIHVIFRR